MLARLPIDRKIRCLLYFKGTSIESVIRELLDLNGDILFFKKRQEFRFEALLQAEVINCDSVVVRSVSRGGISFQFQNRDFNQLREEPGIVPMRIMVGRDCWSELLLELIPVSLQTQGELRARIIKADKKWEDYIVYLENGFKLKMFGSSKAA